MKKWNMRHHAALGLLALSLTAAGQLAACSTAEAGLYEEYLHSRNQSRQDESKSEKVEPEKQEARSQTEEKQPKASADDETPAPGSTASDFNRRIQAIIDGYSSNNRYSRFADTPTVPRDSVYTETISDDGNGNTSVQAGNGTEPQALPPIPTPLTEKRFDFKWVGTPLAQSLYALGSMSGFGIVINGDLSGKVYMNLHNETCKTALDYLGRAYDFNWMFDGNNIIVAKDNSGMLQSEVFHVDYIDKEKLKQEFKSIGLDESHIFANSETGTISVSGTPYQIAEAKKRLKILDAPVAQCLIAAQLIEISHGKSTNLGLSYTLPTYTKEAGQSFPKFKDALNFSVALKADRALDKGKVISRPIVLVRNGEKGNVHFGDRVPVMSSTSTNTSTNVTVTYQDVGTTLDITPVINERTGDISLTVSAEVSNITQYVSQGNTKAPQIATRTVTTSTHVKSGESFIIGGLMSATELDNLTGIPGLMDLPILGQLFKYHSKSKTYGEVYIMITPYIMGDGINAKEIARRVQE